MTHEEADKAALEAVKKVVESTWMDEVAAETFDEFKAYLSIYKTTYAQHMPYSAEDHLVRLIRDMREADPMEYVADGGVTMFDVWRKDADRFLREYRAAAAVRAQREPQVSGIKRFTAIRHNLAERGTHNEEQRNADGESQFEGVIWSDGTVTLRWLTPLASTSVWPDLQTALGVHGHPEYGTEIIWHDCTAPQEWLDRLPDPPASEGEE